MGQCFQTGTVSPAIFCCSRESLFNSTALYSSAAVIFGGLPGTLCYVAIQPCSLDSLIFACTFYSMQKRNFWKAKWVKERAKWVNRKSKIGRFIKHKRKAKWKEKKQILSRPTCDPCLNLSSGGGARVTCIAFKYTMWLTVFLKRDTTY